MIDGIALAVGPDAVVLRLDREGDVVSSAVVGGGVARARAIVNVHVDPGFDGADAEAVLSTYVRTHRVPVPYVGLCTAARTEHASTASVTAGDLTALVVATVGLSHPVAAGTTVLAGTAPSTINTIVVVDASPSQEAMVNLVMTVTEVKVAALMRAGVRCADGTPATGTATDAVVVAATGRGRACRFGGPLSDLGAVVAQGAHAALARGVARWLETHR